MSKFATNINSLKEAKDLGHLVVKCSDYHYKIGSTDYWPSTGKYKLQGDCQVAKNGTVWDAIEAYNLAISEGRDLEFIDRIYNYQAAEFLTNKPAPCQSDWFNVSEYHSEEVFLPDTHLKKSALDTMAANLKRFYIDEAFQSHFRFFPDFEFQIKHYMGYSIALLVTPKILIVVTKNA